MGKNLHNTDIEKKTKEILAEKADFPFEKITLDSSLVNELGIDSFDAIELIFAVDNEFGVKITTDEVSTLSKVGDLVDRIKEAVETKKK